MIKKILLSSIMLFSLHTFAQQGTASPYSFYGIGEIKFKGTVDNRAMGGVGILNDSIHLNLQNPASLPSLKLTTFSVAGTFSPNKLKTSIAEEKAQRTTFDYLGVGFPAGKIGISFGLMPYSNVGYKIEKRENAENSVYEGNGGVNRFFAGAGYELNSKFSFGLQLAYDFGDIDKSSSVDKDGVQYSSFETNNYQISGFNIKTGINFKTKFNKIDFVSNATFSPSSKLTFKHTRFVGTQRGNDTEEVSVPDSKIDVSPKFSIGSGIGVDKKWFVGFESTFQGKSEFPSEIDKISYESASKISLGGFFIPNYNSYSNYFKKIVYRGGFRYENIGLVVNSKSIKDQALTLGLGFPLGGFSNINFSYELGKRGTKSSGLIQENYQNFSIGLSFNDKWFTKRKFD